MGEVVKQIPLEKLILETDCPWCDIRPSHAGFGYIKTTFPTKKDKQYSRDLGQEGVCVKNRSEPCHVLQVAEIVAGIKDSELDDIVEITNENVHKLFGCLER